MIAIFLAGSTATTLPKRMWDSVLLETDPVISAISTLLIMLALFPVVLPALVGRQGSKGNPRGS